jgi:Leucine-rich repeat (LRR) protein
MPNPRFAFLLSVVSFLSAIPAIAAPPVKVLKITERNAKILDSIGDYPDLEVLSIQCLENLQALPKSIGNFSKLRELNIDNGNGCAMNPVLPESIGNLRSLEKLILYGAQAPATHRREMQPAERHKFPESMSQLKNLVYLDLGHNDLGDIPPFVKDLPKLKELRVQWDRKLKVVPPIISSLHELTTLRLDGDELGDLPDFLNSLPKLKRITLGENCEITGNEEKMQDLKRRFPGIELDFSQEYDDCPETKPVK